MKITPVYRCRNPYIHPAPRNVPNPFISPLPVTRPEVRPKVILPSMRNYDVILGVHYPDILSTAKKRGKMSPGDTWIIISRVIEDTPSD
jgi:hypothetical protein